MKFKFLRSSEMASYSCEMFFDAEVCFVLASERLP